MVDGPGRVSAVGEHRADLLGRRGGEDRHAGDGEAQGHVEDAVVAGPVVAGDPGPVEHEDHRGAVQADVEVGLVEGSAEEGRVDRHHRADAAHGHARRRGDLVLLGDADVEEPVGEAGLEREQPGRAGHGGGDGDDPFDRRRPPRAAPGEGVGVGGRAAR